MSSAFSVRCGCKSEISFEHSRKLKGAAGITVKTKPGVFPRVFAGGLVLLGKSGMNGGVMAMPVVCGVMVWGAVTVMRRGSGRYESSGN